MDLRLMILKKFGPQGSVGPHPGTIYMYGIGETTQKELTTVASCIYLISESTGFGLHDLYQDC